MERPISAPTLPACPVAPATSRTTPVASPRQHGGTIHAMRKLARALAVTLVAVAAFVLGAVALMLAMDALRR